MADWTPSRVGVAAPFGTVALGAMIALAAVAGAIEFAIRTPFM